MIGNRIFIYKEIVDLLVGSLLAGRWARFDNHFIDLITYDLQLQDLEGGMEVGELNVGDGSAVGAVDDLKITVSLFCSINE